jgi:hypothetical protein
MARLEGLLGSAATGDPVNKSTPIPVGADVALKVVSRVAQVQS